nr:protein FAR1-RELATED SEQUENCE 5-like [Lolium perenne]
MGVEEVLCEEPQFATPDTGSSQSANKEATVDASAETNDGNQVEMLSSEDIEDFFENERRKTEGVTKNSIEEDLKPCMGMKFSTKEEGQQFFNFYSSVVGFSVAVVNSYRTTSKKRNNEITKVVMQCNKHGRTTQVDREQLVPQRRSTVITKIGCKVEMRITEKNKVWEITQLNLEHNHELSPNSRFFRSHKYMSPEEKDLIRTLKYTNTPTGKIVDILAYVRGGIGCLPYTKKMVSNYGTEINKELQNTDMMEVVHMFNKKQADSPGFYYSFQLDSDNKVRSMFWSDQKSRLYYEQCGDCLSFDTTFLTNKYNLPFAPFVGVSPHGNTYLFACAFIVNEKADTFKWLFEQFLTAMNGVPPVSIITDGDRGMKAAIEEVFPNAFHRWCLFHIKKKADEKITTGFQANEGLYEDFQDIIDNSLTVEEFEYLW